MKMRPWKTYLLWISLTEAVGAASGFASRDGNRIFQETAITPPLSPPGWVFPVVWGLLYALMGISAARIAHLEPAPARNRGLNLYIIQLAVNFFWPLFFFNAQVYGFAFLWLLLLWGLVLWMILYFWQADRKAALLQLPYLLWLSFAAYLNLGVWRLNR